MIIVIALSWALRGAVGQMALHGRTMQAGDFRVPDAVWRQAVALLGR